MKVGIVGAGRLGFALAIALDKKGFDITGVYSKSDESAKLLCDKLNTSLPNDLAYTVRNSDTVFITVPDGQIISVADAICMENETGGIAGKTFFHCSGALSSDELTAISKLGAYTASFHPIQTFADRENSWTGLDRIFFGFEGCNEAKLMAETIVLAFSSDMLVINKENKPLYHAAACIMSNYMVTLSYIAGRLFESIGINAEAGVRAFSPLLKKTVDNISLLGSFDALTGPISRGDYNVVDKHIAQMETENQKMIPVYKLLGRITVEAALQKGSIGEEASQRLLKLLE
ncbi:MAG: DUF2520 domain-containing protein [Clostridia bacterium]|nr:DUF2520 domain-containing protein [Clostridia bacterium]